MADQEIQKGEFKRLFVGENFYILKQFWIILMHNYFSATEADSPHFHEQTSTA